jgi:kynureninase
MLEFIDLEALKEEAISLDAEYPTNSQLFAFPTLKSMGISEKNPDLDPLTKVNYLCGNSLGLMPLQTRDYVNKELDAWSARAVESHFRNEITTDWVDVDLPLIPKLAKIVGAKESEIAIMGTLTMDLNSLLISFYQPDIKTGRTKILFEKSAFPSDYYALYNLAKLKGLDPNETLIQLAPEDDEYNLKTENILSYIEKEGENIALVCFSGIQYYSGQFFNIKKITEKAHEKGCIVGWDLAHAVGNVDLKLHDWNIDFAAWCSYKYLNSGPGAIGGIFINEKHTVGDDITGKPRLAGWWGNDAASRFQMLEKFKPIESALGFRQSNPSVLDVCALNSSLDIFHKCGGIDKLREKSIKLTLFLEKCLLKSQYYKTIKESINEIEPHFIIITPSDPQQRGAQLSLLFKPNNKDVMIKVFEFMNQRGTICDERRPNVIRLAPTPLYNTFYDCFQCFTLLEEALTSLFSL